MKRAIFPVAGVLLLALCLMNKRECILDMHSFLFSYHQPDTSDISHSVKLYYHGNR